MTTKLDLNLLLALEVLLAERNVTRAAKRLNISQPALSSQITRLRALFGDPLFLPTSRGVLPTARALEMQAPLREALDQLRMVIGQGQAFEPASAAMTFAVSGTDYLQIAVLLPFLLQLRSEAPAIRLMVRLGDSRTAAAELERGDVAFLQPENVAAGLRSMEVFQERYVGIVRKGSLPTGSMDIDEFTRAGHVIVSPRAEGFAGPTDDALATIGRQRRVLLAVSSFVFLIEAVAQSDLLALAPERLVDRYRHSVDSFQPPVPVSGFRMAMVWHDRTHLHAGSAWLRSRLAAFCTGVVVSD